MRAGLIVLVIAAAAIAGAKYVRVRNGLAGERQAIGTAWTQVEGALDYRAGVVPDLARAIEQDAPAETAAVKALDDARHALESAHETQQKIQANAQLDNALARALLATENYPRLDSSGKFGKVQDTLKEAEYRIAVERRKYNEAVEHYNARTALFPDNLVASLSGFGKIDAYMPTAADTQTPSKAAY